MNKFLRLLSLLICLSVSQQTIAQIDFENGFYVTNSNDTIPCLIKNLDWKDNPSSFTYKLNETDTPKTLSLKEVNAFSVNNHSYIKKRVSIDMSSNSTALLTFDRNPDFEEKEVFLEVLFVGASTLYQYENGNLSRYFFTLPDGTVEPLIHKNYRVKNTFMDSNKIAENNFYRQQLFNNLKCNSIKQSYIEHLRYAEKELIDFFEKYNTCVGGNTGTAYKKNVAYHWFNLSIRPRLNFSSFSMLNALARPQQTTDFEDRSTFGLGVEAEFVLPFNNNKWSVFVEPTYQYFKSTGENESTHTEGGKQVTHIDYKSVEVPLGLRYGIYLSPKSKLFVDAAFVLDINFSSEIDFRRVDGSSITAPQVNLNSGYNFGFGMGYQLMDRYSLAVRYQTDRDLLSKNSIYSSEYNTVSLIFGYKLF